MKVSASPAVDEAVVDAEREVRALERIGDDVLAVGACDDWRACFATAPTMEDRRLRLVDDRRAHDGAELARAGDGEGAPLRCLRDRQLVRTGARSAMSVQRAGDAAAG
jgi:hypothetical protein